jgi:hypothetical protein
MTKTIGNEYAPSEHEEAVTGGFGVFLFSLMLVFSFSSVFIWQIRNRTNKLFFASVFMMCVFEIPRYAMMTQTGTYDNNAGYGMHVMAGIFFFLSFSLVTYQWAGILNMTGIFGAIYSPEGLFITNALFAILDIISASHCFAAGELTEFFYSGFFLAVTVMETTKNLAFSGLLMYFGIKLLMRFQNYTMSDSSTAMTRASSATSGIAMQQAGGALLSKGAERSDTSGSGGIGIGIVIGSGSSSSSDRADMVGNSDRSVDFFQKALNRITAVLVVATLCFALRITMLICKLVAFHDDVVVTTPAFPLFGFGWFIFSDFIPRLVPTSAFITAMLLSHRHTEEDKVYLAQQANKIGNGSFSDMLDPSHSSGDEGERSSDERVSDDDIELRGSEVATDRIPAQAI